MAPNKCEESVRLLREVSHVLAGEVPRSVIELPAHDAYVLTMYSRARSMYEGVVVLIEHGLPREGFILARSLFTESPRLMELASMDTRRAALTLRWAEDSISHTRRLFQIAHELGWEHAIDQANARLDEQVCKIRRYRDRHNTGPSQHFDGDETLAQRHNRLHDYWSFLFAHQVTHGNESDHLHRVHRVDADTIGIFMKNIDPDLVEAVAGFAMKSALLAHRSACAIFGWAMPATLDHLLTEAGRLQFTT